MAFTDRTLQCRECGGSFLFSASEQEFYSSRGFTNEPKRCPSCRQSRRFDRGDSWSGGGGGGGERYRSARQTYSVTCASCGKPAEVPFQPRQDRPVYCTDCYAKVRQSGPR